MIIDKALYLLLPRAVHAWGAANRAKVRAYVLGALVPLIVAGAEMYAPEEWRGVVISVLVSTGAYGVGRGTHKVVKPWDQDA